MRETVFSVAAKPSPSDAFGRLSERNGLDFSALPSWNLGVPDAQSLEFFGDDEFKSLFQQAIAYAQSLGAQVKEIPFAPFLEAAKLLYEGPWVAERYRAVRALIETNPGALLPVTRTIIERGANSSAADVFEAMEKLAVLKKKCDAAIFAVDAVLTPTIATGYTIAQMEADPIRLNSNLGYYTNFMNLLDYAAIALPSGFRDDGLPFGVTFFAPAHADVPLLHLGARWQLAHKELPLGATAARLSESGVDEKWSGAVSVAVCGAHMSGLPLNSQLTSRGARLLSKTRTAPTYRFYALPGGPPFRPGLIRVAEGGNAVEVEVWSVPVNAFGSFVAGIPSPLGIGVVELEDGARVQGFVCEDIAAVGAQDISAFGSWRNYLSSR